MGGAQQVACMLQAVLGRRPSSRQLPVPPRPPVSRLLVCLPFRESQAGAQGARTTGGAQRARQGGHSDAAPWLGFRRPMDAVAGRSLAPASG